MSVFITRSLIYSVVTISLAFLIIMVLEYTYAINNFELPILFSLITLIPTYIILNKYLPLVSSKKRKLNFFFKSLLIIISLVIGYFLAFVYLLKVYAYTNELCAPLIPKSSLNITNQYGLNKYWYQLEDCGKQMFPFPWIKKPVISDNPPEFIPIERNSESNIK